MLHTRRSTWNTLALAAGLALAIVAAIAVSQVLSNPTSTHAQSTIQLEISKELNNSSDVVRVGEILTFTIRITNQSPGITVTELPLYDSFDAEILRFVAANPPADQTETGALTWTNLINQVGPLAPGQSVEVTTYFRAIRPREATVNFARIGTAQGIGGETGGGGGDEAPGPPAEGGKLPVTKVLATDGVIRVGQLISFSLGIVNDGAAAIDSLPFEDEYNAAALLFVSADPAPDSIDVVSPTGMLRWQNLGPLAPGEVITITSVYSTLAAFDGTINSARAVDAEDEFGNLVGDAQPAQVPIRIVDDQAAAPTVIATTTPDAGPAATAASTATSQPEPQDSDDGQQTPEATTQSAATEAAVEQTAQAPTPTEGLAETPAATPSAAAVATAALTPQAGAPTATPGGPSRLPRAGAPAASVFVLLALLAGAALVLGRRIRQGID